MINFVGSDIHSQKHIDKMKEKIKIKNIEKLNKAIDSNKLFR